MNRKIIWNILLLTAMIIIIVIWSDRRDMKLNEMAEVYEQCVKTEYNTTPSFWYEEHGEYPTCPPTTAHTALEIERKNQMS